MNNAPKQPADNALEPNGSKLDYRGAPSDCGHSAFGLITLEAESVGLPPFRQGIEFPNPDFAALARACGGHGFRATKPGELHVEINEALSIDGPAIVDVVVAADEMPNFPHLELDKVGHYAIAKIKEAILAVTGP